MWQDVDFEKHQVNVRRSIVSQVAGRTKNVGSARPMPLHDYMIDDLLAWYAMTPYKEPIDYVFATDANRAGEKRGKQPCWPNKVMDYWIRPVAEKAGIAKRIGWHMFRHTFSNLLRANGEDVKTVQELLRHSSARVTLDLYSQAITQDKRDAQSRLVKMFATDAFA
jgi:integrase